MKKYTLTVLIIAILAPLSYGQLLYEIEMEGTLRSEIDHIQNYDGDPSDAELFNGNVFKYTILIDTSIADIDPANDRGRYAAILESTFTTNTFSVKSQPVEQFGGNGVVLIQESSDWEYVLFVDAFEDAYRINPVGEEMHFRMVSSPFFGLHGGDLLSSDSLLDAMNAFATATHPSIGFRWDRIADSENSVWFSSYGTIETLTVTAVPEPSTFAMIGLSLVGFIFFRKRSRKGCSN